MCENCCLTGFYEFATWQDFEVLEKKLLSQQLVLIQRPDEEATWENKRHYQCGSCQDVWVLSEPENSWRGYFLPHHVAVAHSGKRTVQDEVRRIGCLALLVLLSLYILWQWVVQR